MRHVFRATLMGWKREQEGIWFDSSDFTKEEAKAEFKRFQGTTDRGYPYTGYEYAGKRYHDVHYLGEYEDDKMPRNNWEYIDSLLARIRL